MRRPPTCEQSQTAQSILALPANPRREPNSPSGSQRVGPIYACVVVVPLPQLARHRAAHPSSVFLTCTFLVPLLKAGLLFFLFWRSPFRVNTLLRLTPFFPAASCPQDRSDISRHGPMGRIKAKPDHYVPKPKATRRPVIAARRLEPAPPPRRRYRPGTRALREIRHFQKGTGILIPRKPFERVVRAVADQHFPGLRVAETVFLTLRQAAEA